MTEYADKKIYFKNGPFGHPADNTQIREISHLEASLYHHMDPSQT